MPGHVVQIVAFGRALNLFTAQLEHTVLAVALHDSERNWPGWHTVQFEQAVEFAAAQVPAAQLLHTLFVVAEQAELRYSPAVQLLAAQAAQGASTPGAAHCRPEADQVPGAHAGACSHARLEGFQRKPAAQTHRLWPVSVFVVL